MLSLFSAEVTIQLHNNTPQHTWNAYLHDLLGGYVVYLFIAEVTTSFRPHNKPLREGTMSLREGMRAIWCVSI